jgi:hypothetical protein
MDGEGLMNHAFMFSKREEWFDEIWKVILSLQPPYFNFPKFEDLRGEKGGFFFFFLHLFKK